MTNEEMLLTALANGATINPKFQPQNNKQAYLAYLCGLEINLPAPRTAEEALMRLLCENGGGNEGGASDAVLIVHSTSKGEGVVGSYSTYTSVTIPDGITEIGDSAFNYWRKITTINIPNTVASIGSYAFGDCNSLTSITIPDSVTSIGNYAFQSCESLKSATIGKGVVRIGSSAFSTCSSLESVTFKGTPSSIDSNVFYKCDKLTTIYVPWAEGEVANAPWGAVNATIFYAAPKPSEGLEYTLNDDGETYSVSGIGTCTDTDVVIASTYEGKAVTGIGDAALSGHASLTSITIPDSITSIGHSALAACSLLASVDIGNGVEAIPDFMFYNCPSLTSVTMHADSVTKIGQVAFYECTSLESITLPASITSIDASAFAGCENLLVINVPWAEGAVEGSPWGAVAATINYNYSEG